MNRKRKLTALYAGKPLCPLLVKGKTVAVVGNAKAIFSPCDAVKIDVEGAELRVLSGMHETLQRDSLMLFIDVHIKMGVSIRSVARTLVQYGFSVYTEDLKPIGKRRPGCHAVFAMKGQTL